MAQDAKRQSNADRNAEAEAALDQMFGYYSRYEPTRSAANGLPEGKAA